MMASGHLTKCGFLLLVTISVLSVAQHPNNSTYRPIVLVHGIAAGSESLNHVVQLLQQEMPGVYIHNSEIGDGKWDSVFMDSPKQVATLCEELSQDKNLGEEVTLIGFSQGGLIGRGFMQKCNVPAVKVFISWVSPQMGIFGIPYLNLLPLDEAFDLVVYDKELQDLFSFASYWKDPFRLNEYVNDSIFLSDLNNEKAEKNDSYKDIIKSLDHFAISYSHNDSVLVPKETGWFGFFAPNSAETIVPLENSTFYLDDWLGIRYLDEHGRLSKFSTTCIHQDYSSSCFDHYFSTYVLPYIK